MTSGFQPLNISLNIRTPSVSGQSDDLKLNNPTLRRRIPAESMSTSATPPVSDIVLPRAIYPEHPHIKIDWVSYSDLEIPKEIWALAKGTGYKYIRVDESERHLRTSVQAQDYDKKSPEQHVYFVPDMYVGAIEPIVRSEWLLDLKNKKLQPADISLSCACERIFLEIISNSGDATFTSRLAKVDPGAIEVMMNRRTIRVRNYGVPIPVLQSEKFDGHYIPEIIFGTMLTSSNYNQKVIRMGCGRNGLGAKLANIFSKGFMVRIADDINKKLIVIVWLNNMTEMSYFHLQNYSGPSYVEITYTLDFDRFEMKEYTDEALGLFARYTLDFSLSCKVPVSFNGILLDYRNIRDYCSLYWPEEICKTAIIHYEWPGGRAPPGFERLSQTAKEKFVAAPTSAEQFPTCEIALLDTPDAGVAIAYTNGLMNIRGGVHVNTAYKQFSDPIIKSINDIHSTDEEKKKKEKKSTAVKTPAIRAPKLNISDFRPHVSMVFNYRCADTRYLGQTKTELAFPTPTINVTDKLIKMTEKWNLIARLMNAYEAKLGKKLSANDGKKKRYIDLDHVQDAIKAGSDESLSCTAFFVEGLSALSYPEKYRCRFPDGIKYLGYAPLQGKIRNVTNSSLMDIVGDKQINAIKEFVGLKEFTDYKITANLMKLRYGFICVLADGDADGLHIVSLMANLFYRRFRSLIEMGRFGYLRTPFVRIFDGKNVIARFYLPEEFESYRKTHDISKYYVKYYKGLGTSLDPDIEDDSKTAPTVVIICDNKCNDSFDIAFDAKMADARKDWIQQWRNVTQCDDVCIQSIQEITSGRYFQQMASSFLKREKVVYDIEALFRAIGGTDGLKLSQRKAFYTGLVLWNYGKAKSVKGLRMRKKKGAQSTDDEKHRRREARTMKVNVLASNVITTVGYHHGDDSIKDTIIKMAQDFVGANNIPLFTRDGQFGTRREGGKNAAAARYSETQLDPITQYIIYEEDVNVIKFRTEEDRDSEPEWLPFIIPLQIINGSNGIATGWSTYIPNHHVYETINCLREMCMGNKNPKYPHPWYYGFKGNIRIVDNRTRKVRLAQEAAKKSSLVPLSIKIPSIISNSASVIKSSSMSSISSVTELSCVSTSSITSSPALSIPIPDVVLGNRHSDSKNTDSKDDDDYEDEEDGDDKYDKDDDLPNAAEMDYVDVGLNPEEKKHRSRYSMATYGEYKVTQVRGDKADVLITELPVGRYTQLYEKWLKSLIKEGSLKDIENYSTDTEIKIILKGFIPASGRIDYRSLRLKKSYGLGNMVLIDNQGFPTRYKNIVDIIENYYKNMIQVFTEVIKRRIKDKEEQIKDTQYRLKFVNAVNRDELKIRYRPIADIEADMKKMDIPTEYLDKVTTRGLAREKAEEIQKKLDDFMVELTNLKKLTPEKLWIDKLNILEGYLRKIKYPE